MPLNRLVFIVLRSQGWTFGYPFGFGSDISDFRVFRYSGIEPVRVYLHFGSGSNILCSGSDISSRFRYLEFEEK